MRWALGEDADLWLPLRGKVSRSQPCIWRGYYTRSFPAGPGHGALCQQCLSPLHPRDLALASTLTCVDSSAVKVQRFPPVLLESALLPTKGLCTNRSFSKGATIATFANNDCRLRLLLMQYRRLPFPTATACLLPYTCHCGATHLRLQATNDLPADAILLLGEAKEWQGCLVQFDGSAHKITQTGGAGVSLLQVTQDNTTLVHWLSLPLSPCADNVVAGAKACLAALELASEHYLSSLRRGEQLEGVVVQGDILPIINYLQHRGRVKKASVVANLDKCQHSLLTLLSSSVWFTCRDYFAGRASPVAKEAVADLPTGFHYAAPPPFQLAQRLGFVIEQGDRTSAPAFLLTECPSLAPPELSTLLHQQPQHRFTVRDYLTTAAKVGNQVAVGYKPAAYDSAGRYYAVGNTAQRLPRSVRLLLFGATHWEVDMSGAHYELVRRLCRASNVHLDLLPVAQVRALPFPPELPLTTLR